MRSERGFSPRRALGLAAAFLLTSALAQADESDEAKAKALKFTHQVIVATGKEDSRLQPFDQLMTSFMREHHVPGASLAVMSNGKIVYARGFGFRELETREPVLPTSLFRIASISKPITAVAIMQLVEKGQLSLDDHVFDIVKSEPYFEDDRKEVDSRLSAITIRQCLQHTGGWDRDQSFDPMFQSVRIAKALGVEPPANPQHIIRFMLGKPLDFDPGQRYSYSNFGYSLLGRVIEIKSGRTYEDYVRDNIFAPLKIHRARLGQTRERGSFEVKYYDEKQDQGPSVFGDSLEQSVPQPYGAWYLEAMDAHGGWLASAVDLVQFSSAVHAGSKGGLLSDASIAAMFERPPGLPGYEEAGQPRETFYGLGWMVRPQSSGDMFNSWHTGSLPGTSTLLVHRYDGRHWAVLFNTRNDPMGQRLSTQIDPLLHQAADAVKEWP